MSAQVKVKPSTRMHEVIRRGGKYPQIVCVGSRTACNKYWVALSPQERVYHEVQVAR
jgi:hypothetical protein